MELTIRNIKDNLIALNIEDYTHKRIKGHLRQLEILKFLAIWKFATKRQLAYLTGTREENLYKHLNRLLKLGFIKIHKHYGKSIIEISKRGLELIAYHANINYEFLKTKEKWKKENIEHDLVIRDFAIRYYDFFQRPVKTSLYFREIYNRIDNKKYAQKLIRSLHKADFVILYEEVEKLKVFGVEYEHTYKNLKDIRKKMISMIDSIGFFSNYLIIAKDENIFENFRKKIYKSIDVGKKEHMNLIYISNLDNSNDFKYSAYLETIAEVSAKELLQKLKNIGRIFYIEELAKKTK